jgi:hypothetical protein
MKYYFINNSIAIDVLGHYPQVKDIKQNCNIWDEPKFIEHIQFKEIDFIPITANAILNSKSKLTDLINVTGIGFTRKLLISKKLKIIFEKSRKTGLQFFKSDLIYKNNIIEDYWILNIYKVDMQFIDYSKSDIYKTEYTVNKTEKILINTYSEFLNKRNQIHKQGYPSDIFIENFNLNQNVTEDFFAILNVMGGVNYIVSEKLKKEIEYAGCTGIEFQPIELSYQEWVAPGGMREKIYGKV